MSKTEELIAFIKANTAQLTSETILGDEQSLLIMVQTKKGSMIMAAGNSKDFAVMSAMLRDKYKPITVTMQEGFEAYDKVMLHNTPKN